MSDRRNSCSDRTHKPAMTFDQIATLGSWSAVVAALIWDKLRADVVALTGAAVLLMPGVVRPVEVQGAFASPAIIALAWLFVIAYAIELSGLLDAAIRPRSRCASAHRRGRNLARDRPVRRASRRFSTTRRSSCWRARGARRGPVAEAVAQALPDAAVLRRRAGRLLHADRHLDQSAGQRHGAARRPAGVRPVRDHAGRAAVALAGGALPVPVQRPADRGRARTRRQRDGRRGIADRADRLVAGARWAMPSLFAEPRRSSRRRLAIALAIFVGASRSPRWVWRRSRRRPSPAPCC